MEITNESLDSYIQLHTILHVYNIMIQLATTLWFNYDILVHKTIVLALV